MGITSWPAVKERYALPKKFNLAIDANGIFYMAQPSKVVKLSYMYNLISKAAEVCIVFDGEVPQQKMSERFRRQLNRPAFTHYFRNNGEQDILYAVSRVAHRPILVERSNSYGEGEHKVLMCDAWLNPTLPILCLVNDNDFFQFLINVVPYTDGELGTTEFPYPYIQHDLPSNSLRLRYFECTDKALAYNYYKVDSRGVLDFWRPYTLAQRKKLVVKTTIYWGNDYIVPIAPSVKWDSIVASIDDSEFPDTYEAWVTEIVKTFRELELRWSCRTTHISTLHKKLVPAKLGSYEQIENAIQQYLERLIWCLTFIRHNQSNPGPYQLELEDGIVLSWPSFSMRMPKVTPVIPLLGHFTERERYYRLACVKKY